eukprot:921194-Prymnesium_polylepis.1
MHLCCLGVQCICGMYPGHRRQPQAEQERTHRALWREAQSLGSREGVTSSDRMTGNAEVTNAQSDTAMATLSKVSI